MSDLYRHLMLEPMLEQAGLVRFSKIRALQSGDTIVVVAPESWDHLQRWRVKTGLKQSFPGFPVEITSMFERLFVRSPLPARSVSEEREAHG